MEVKVLGTGSSGNCYILTSKATGHSIMLDCGLKFKDITHSAMFCGFDKLDCVLCTHAHLDHSLALQDFKNSGCNIFSYETLEIGKPNKKKFGQWILQAFPVEHNATCWGFIIKDAVSNQMWCYVTDFVSMPQVEGIDNWIYEINYNIETLEKIVEKQKTNEFYVQMGYKNHNSLDNAVQYFKSLETKPKNLFICHISQNHLDKKLTIGKMKKFCEDVGILAKGTTYTIKE